MKPRASIVLLGVLSAFAWTSSAPGPSAAAPAPVAQGTGPTGALGILPDPNFGPGTHVIDLATTGTYDPALWVVVLDYQAFTVQSGATLTFANHPTRAAVVIRATGAVTIDGVLILDGADGHSAETAPSFAEPGPGGYRGGRGEWAHQGGQSAGLGAGGGFLGLPTDSHGGCASHRTLGIGSGVGQVGEPGPLYGSPAGSPLVGGSGGASSSQGDGPASTAGGGAGGGAILIGSDLRVSIGGRISTRGGYGPYSSNSDTIAGQGSGGFVRLFAPEVEVLPATPPSTPTLDARGSQVGGLAGGHGGIRIEVDGLAGLTLEGLTYPEPSTSLTLGEFLPQGQPEVALIAWWDPDAGAMGDWLPLPADPNASLDHPSLADLQVAEAGPAIFLIEGRDVPLGSQLHVRVTRARGQAEIDSTHTMGESTGPAGEASTLSVSWTDVTIDLSEGVSAIQVRAELP